MVSSKLVQQKALEIEAGERSCQHANYISHNDGGFDPDGKGIPAIDADTTLAQHTPAPSASSCRFFSPEAQYSPA